MRVFLRWSRGTTCPATGLGWVFAIHATSLALTKNVTEHQSDFRTKKKNGMEDVGQKGKRDLLASPIRAPLGRLPTGDLTLPTEVACKADCLPPLPGLPGLFVIRTEGNSSDNRLPLP